MRGTNKQTTINCGPVRCVTRDHFRLPPQARRQPPDLFYSFGQKAAYSSSYKIPLRQHPSITIIKLHLLPAGWLAFGTPFNKWIMDNIIEYSSISWNQGGNKPPSPPRTDGRTESRGLWFGGGEHPRPPVCVVELRVKKAPYHPAPPGAHFFIHNTP